MATKVPCGWARALFEVIRPLGQEQWGQRNKITKDSKTWPTDQPTDGRTDKAFYRVACPQLKKQNVDGKQSSKKHRNLKALNSTHGLDIWNSKVDFVSFKHLSSYSKLFLRHLFFSCILTVLRDSLRDEVVKDMFPCLALDFVAAHVAKLW